MRGHIKLGAVGALRDYMLVDVRQYLEALANQMAAQIGGGAGDYNDLQSWGAWVMDDWRAGSGKKDAEAGGFLFSTTETRYPNQMFLPRHLHFEMTDAASLYALDASTVTGTATVGTGQTKEKWAVQIGGGSLRGLSAIWIYLSNDGAAYTIRLSDDTAGAPGTSIATATVTTNTDRPGYGWYKTTAISQSITSAAYWISLEPTTTGIVPIVGNDHAGTAPTAAYYNGSSWVSTTDYFGLLLNTEAYADDNAVPRGAVQVAEFNDELYSVSATATRPYKRDEGTAPGWVTSVATTVRGTQVFALGDLLYFANPLLSVANLMNASETVTSFSLPSGGTGEVAYYALWGGLLWAAQNGSVYYTNIPGADGADWTGPIDVGFTGEVITGIAGLGDYLYVATEKELVYVGYGDEVRGVTTWGSPSADMGKGMIHYQGSLYIPNQEALLRWDGSNMLPMGIDLGEGLPDEYQGNVAALAANNNWLLMGVNPRSTTSNPTVWAHNGQGWHHIAMLPPSMNISCLYYRRSNQRLYVGTDTGHVFSLYLPDVAGVVDNTEPEYTPVGWLETDWWYGGLREVRKDMESVFLLGENLAAAKSIKVYWKDDESTDWELLGTATADRTELRWNDYDTRPNTRQLKLGFLMQTDNPGVTPVLRAVRVKYHAMVMDWERFRLPIQVSDAQMMVDDDINPYTALQQWTQLKALSKQVPPCIFENPFGIQYEVKIVDASFQIDRYEWLPLEGRASISGVYHVTVEQVTQNEYTGS